MSKKNEPISVEKTDNSDGSYIKKYVYDKFPDIFFEYLSKIEFYTPENIIQKCEYYSDDKFQDLYTKENREYNSVGSYIKKYIYIKPNEYGWMSVLEEYDSNNKYLGGKYYTDNNFTNLGLTETREYNPDGSYVEKWIYTKPNKNGWLSELAEYDSNNKCLGGKCYTDNNFTNLGSTVTREYNPDGSYIEKFIYIKPNKNGWLSLIEKYDSNNKYLEGTCYFDNNFMDLGLRQTNEYNENSSYVEKIIYTRPDENGCLSLIKKFDSNNNMLGGDCYFNNNFTDLGLTVTREYNEDGGYIKKVIYTRPDENGWLSLIEKFDSNNKYLDGSYYFDSNFTDLGLTVIREYNENDSYVEKYICTKPSENGWLSMIGKYDANNKYLDGSYYFDNNFTDLGEQVIFEYNEDGSFLEKFIYTKPDEDGWLSMIGKYDANNKYLDGSYYFDNNFTTLGLTETREYNTDGSYIKKYGYPQNDEFKFKKETYDINNKIKTTEFYNDTEGKELVAKYFYSYKNSKQIKKSVFEKPYNNLLSSIEIKENNMLKKTIAYSDRNFKEKLRVQYFKHFKDNSYIRLREYKKPQDKILAEITKFNKDKEILYTKQYKFKGLLAKILFWLAR